MQPDIVFKSEFISITIRQDGFYIESFRKGMTQEQFNMLMSSHPEIKITGIMAVKNALVNAPRAPEKFGKTKERIIIDVSEDGLRAFMTLCVGEEDLSESGKANLFKEILGKLHEKGITFGIKNDVLLGNLENDRQILAAEGIAAVDGVDSWIKMYELSEVRPEVKENGNVDHRELNLINRVNMGDWLGERTDPGEGSAGRTVTDGIILPAKGNLLPLLYDKNTVKEVNADGKTTLYARINGAVHYDEKGIGVSNHLEIIGNVGFKTGNIEFDGFLTVKGSIEDSFSVEASKDIEILSDLGLGSVKEIVSREGSILIKGGIAGKNKAVIRGRKNIYTKFVSDTTIICEGSVHIGFYCLNSTIKAKEIILDSPGGQIIGGNTEAEIKVAASIIGSSSEKRTNIIVKGFDRKILKSNADKLAEIIESVKDDLYKAKQEMAVCTNTSNRSKDHAAMLERIRGNYFEIRDNLKRLEEERKILISYLKTAGEGEIAVMKKVYPNTVFEIKGITKEINKPLLGSRFFAQDGEIKEI